MTFGNRTMNLLQETIECLRDYDKSPTDVIWCGESHYGKFTWDEFAAVANFDYDASYGTVEVATQLKIVGKDFWLERHQYDGSEWWEYKTLPTEPSVHRLPILKYLQTDYDYEEDN